MVCVANHFLDILACALQQIIEQRVGRSESVRMMVSHRLWCAVLAVCLSSRADGHREVDKDGDETIVNFAVDALPPDDEVDKGL